MKYQIDSPSESDLFDSQGHSNAAWAMKDTLENHSGVHIIGLEGDLGAGKSTVLKLLEKGINSNQNKQYRFFTFDVEQYHHSSTKASLIQFFSNKLKETYQSNQSQIDEAKDKALGNLLTYTKKVNSSLSLWTVAFAVLLLMFARSAKDLVGQFTNPSIIPDDQSVPSIVSSILSNPYPAMVLLGILLCLLYVRLIKKEPIGNLVKKNSDDSISEKLLRSLPMQFQVMRLLY